MSFPKSHSPMAKQSFWSVISLFTVLALLGSMNAPTFAEHVNPYGSTAQEKTQPHSSLALNSSNSKVGKLDPEKKREYERVGNQILSRIKTQNQLPNTMVKEFQILDSNELNAATDGEQIVFTSKLWELLKNNDQRAFVLSHEISHIDLNHVQKTAIRRIGLVSLSEYLGKRLNQDTSRKSQFLNAAQAAGLMMLDMKFSRSAEYDADRHGLLLMQRAGFNPQAAVETMVLLEQNAQDGTPEFLRTHPLSRSRIEALTKPMAPEREKKSKWTWL